MRVSARFSLITVFELLQFVARLAAVLLPPGHDDPARETESSERSLR